MCVVSMVFDQWSPHIPPATVPITYPNTIPWRAPVQEDPVTIPADVLRRLLDTFEQAYEAAKEFDELTGQPDCEDPEKAKLLERVEVLERRLDEIGQQPQRDHSNIFLDS